jgi:replicative DNA helicase
VDFDLLQLVRNKEQFLRFKPHLKDHALGKETQKLLAALEEFFAHYGSKEADWHAFETWFFLHKTPQIGKDSVSTYKDIFVKLRTVPPTIAADDLLKHFVACDYATQIANEAVKGGHANIDLIEELVGKYNKEVQRSIDKSELFVGDNITGVLGDVRATGLEWRLEELNISCGPLKQGDFIIVSARPETGKTTFLASEVSHMASQMTHTRPVVWVNNEERSYKVQLRITQAALGMTLKDIEADPTKAMAEYKRLMKMDDRILVTGSNAGLNNAKLLVPLFRDLNPAMIVFDQLDKVVGFDSKSKGGERDDLRLGALYQWARELSHEYGPVIAASQASDAAEGEQWIYQNQLRGSRTDKAGEADAIITIGKVHEPTKENTRYIHVPKNKLHGGLRSIEKERHGKWEVEINPEIARYEGTR